MNVNAHDMLGVEGPLARIFPRYESRPPQQAMAKLVEDTLENEGIALIEAGTGTGKTLAYLLPAVLSGRKTIISTGTRALQDQIMEQDIPLLSKMLGKEVAATALKGLGNYICRRRLHEFTRSPEALKGTFSRALADVEAWTGESTLGDRAELASVSEIHPIWSLITSSTETRIGSRCRFFDDCFVGAARRQAEDAQIVVINHHLFFADLALRHPAVNAGVLPMYDAVVFDEAHQMESIATMFFGAQISDQAIEQLVRDIDRSRGGLFGERIDDLLSGLLHCALAFFDRLPDSPPNTRAELDQSIYRGGEGAELYHRLDASLEAVHLKLGRLDDDNPNLEALARRAQRMRNELARVVDESTVDQVVWFERRDDQRIVGSSPVEVGGLFRTEVADRVPSVVLTSATLTTGGSFNYMRSRLGLPPEIDEVQLESPFDYASAAALYLPSLPDPRDADYPNAAEDEITRLLELSRGGAFVLCTSIKQMERLANAIRRRLRGHPIYVQGDAPKNALLARFREDGDAILFATMSFWQGVDVPGDALRMVIIDRLPFDVPTDPLVMARCKKLEDAGESAFMKLLVPSAALTLKQGFGRLIRSRKDRGVVAILDSRIKTKGYGKVMLRSLPPAKRVESFEALQPYFRSEAPLQPRQHD